MVSDDRLAWVCQIVWVDDEIVIRNDTEGLGAETWDDMDVHT